MATRAAAADPGVQALALKVEGNRILNSEGEEVRLRGVNAACLEWTSDGEGHILETVRVAIEAGVTDGWWKYGCAAVVGVDTYGESAPAGALFKHFNLTTGNLVDTVRKVLGR